jgi:hypothetical protein
MKYRHATLLDDTVYTTDGTEPIDINVDNPISELIIRFQPKTGAEAASDHHFMSCIPKIELVDGSDTLFSLSGKEAHALDWYSHGIVRTNIFWYLANTTQDIAIHIPFGRYLWDPILALVPGKFTNPQLKITRDIDGGGFNNSQITMSVFAQLFDEKAVTPTGFLMSKEIKDYALGASTHGYTDLPLDYPYRKLLLRIQKEGTGPEYCFNNIKISEDVDKKVPLNHTIQEILHGITSTKPPYREWIIATALAAGRYFHITPAYWPGLAASVWSNSISATDIAVYEGDGGRMLLTQDPAVRNMCVLVQGWCPHGVIEIPFGDQEDIDDWYTFENAKSIKLDILAASGMSSSESCQVFLQQHRSYS